MQTPLGAKKFILYENHHKYVGANEDVKIEK